MFQMSGSSSKALEALEQPKHPDFVCQRVADMAAQQMAARPEDPTEEDQRFPETPKPLN